VHGVLDPGGGFGFATAQVFVLDGSLTNLGDLRRTILSRGDPRVLGLLHEGTRSSPLPPRRALREADLDAALAEAGSRLTEPPYVSLDADAREIVVAHFYGSERVRFEGHARSLGELPTVVAWIAHHARPSVRDAVLRAEADGFALRVLPEDRALSTHAP
jgi:hypothetical protein